MTANIHCIKGRKKKKMKRWHIIITMPECEVSISPSNTKWNSSWRARAGALWGIVFCWKVVFELRMLNNVTVLTVHLSFSTHIYNSMWVAGWGGGRGTLLLGRKGTSRIQIRHFRPTGRRRDFFFFFAHLTVSTRAAAWEIPSTL